MSDKFSNRKKTKAILHESKLGGSGFISNMRKK